ncbi:MULTISPECIES: endonuclease/exonuclease/phosphatase family protein [Streptomyces]|uniref:endonuclease/exonuclease/phosphatase family protein n=1 Tax=Streptomyces TaxID=1883 RepID=UPI0004CB7310|nr:MULTISPECIES: endonuclease/exonuclease/phosphatase family protein [Streptomyces]MDI6408626.1 endonuclease/exonuclease/phosphatase family protein [Streptomyces albus]
MYTGATTRPGRDATDDVPAGRRRRHRFTAVLCALTLLGLTVVLGFRAADEDGPTPVPQLLAFLPWFLVPAWLALLAAALARRWLLLCWALVVLAGTGWFLRPYGPPAPQGAATRPPETQFRILTANLKYGAATADLVATVRRERPQVVAVQECDFTCTAALDSPALREEYPHRVVAGVDGGARGSALLSVYPLHEQAGVRGRLAMPGAVADVHGHRIALQIAHPMPPLPGDTATWRRELGRLRAYAAARRLPTLIAGDFNSSQDHAAFRAVLRTGMHDAARMLGNSRAPTWPARTTPVLGAQIDHVLLSRELVPVDGTFLKLAGSDHRALLVNVKLF